MLFQKNGDNLKTIKTRTITNAQVDFLFKLETVIWSLFGDTHIVNMRLS